MMQTDHLVVGGGAAGMAFVDELVTASDAEVVLIDRRDRPGGHWNEAYPFLRLHQPSAIYGVNSRRLGDDRIVTSGPEAGLYERATGAEVADYYQQVLDEQLLASGRVRFLGGCEYQGTDHDGHRVRSLRTGELFTIRTRRRLVDATYLEASVPATHAPSFSVGDGVRLCTPTALAAGTPDATGYAVLGAGKTAMDTCTWLLEQGVAPDDIRWVRPRDPWVIDRAWMQPLELVASVVEWYSHVLEVAATAADVRELFARLEQLRAYLRLDPTHEPTVCRYATLGAVELERLRTIEDVVRLGRVRHLGSDQIVLEQGSVANRHGHLAVDCTAPGLRRPPPRPVFEPGRITLQTVSSGFQPLNAARIGFVEASWDDDGDRNLLCPPNRLPDTVFDWVATTAASERASRIWSQEPELGRWAEGARLNIAAGLFGRLDDPRVATAVGRTLANRDAAIDNLDALWSRRHSPARGDGPVVSGAADRATGPFGTA